MHLNKHLSVVALALVATTGSVITAAPASAAITAPASVKTTGFKTPLKYGTYKLTSAKGPRCMPTNGATTEHLGQDMGAANGAPIYAVLGGKVVYTRSGTSSLSGYIVIESVIDGKRMQFAYIHQWVGAKYFKVGDTVKAGQRIGDVGSSGPATGPHLHLELWEGTFMKDKSIDPVAFLKARGVNLTANATAVYKNYVPASCTYYARSSGDVHQSASTGSKKITSFAKGAKALSWPGAMSNKMLKVKVNGKTGYVAWNSMSPFYVAPSAKIVVSTKAGLAGDKFKTTANLNLRSSARDGSVKMLLAKGSEVTATGRTALGADWFEIEAGSTTGWSSASYLKKASESKAPVVTKPTKKVTAKVKTKKTTANVWMRTAAKTGKTIVALKKNTTVTLSGSTKKVGKITWYKIKAVGKTGWTSGAYLR